MNNEQLFKNLALRLLDDDDGIAEDAYEALLDLGEDLGLTQACLELNGIVDATDGRFYINQAPEGWELT